MLLSNGIDFAAVDEAGNNALHVAVREGNVRTARVLLTESRSGFNIVKGTHNLSHIHHIDLVFILFVILRNQNDLILDRKMTCFGPLHISETNLEHFLNKDL